MKEKVFMSVDLGTSLIKAAAFTLDGNCISIATEPVRDERPAPGIFIQKGDYIFESVVNCLTTVSNQLGDKVRDVEGIAFTGQMAGAMGVDENFNDVTTFSCSMDSRYLPYANAQREQYADIMYEIGGTSSPVMCSKYSWYKNEFPEEHKRIAKYVMVNGYVIGRLAGLKADDAKIDYSLITWTGLADVKNLKWSDTICKALDINPSILPKIVAPTTIGGYLDAKIADMVGLPSGVPLVVGAGDKIAGCTGAAILDEGETMFEAGSYGAICCNVKDFRLDIKNRNYDIIGTIDPKMYGLHKYIQGSGIVLDWFVESFMREKGDSKADAFAYAESAAKDIIPGSENMMAIGLLSGSAIPFDSELKGMFLGHTLNHTKGHFYHALLESFSYDLMLTVKSLNEQYPEYSNEPVKLIGGGAKSTVWPQMLADVTGRTFQKLRNKDVAPWGAALIAAKAVGAIDDIYSVAKDHVEITETIVPNMDTFERYQPYVRFYERIKQQMSNSYKELSRL